MTPLDSAIIGSISGLHSACWGAYKDSPYEGFDFVKFVRSVLVGFVLGFLLGQLSPFSSVPGANPGVLFAYVMAAERFLTEMYKAFVRSEPQEKYRIPSRFHVLGKPVSSTPARLCIGIVVIAVTLLLFERLADRPTGMLSGGALGLTCGIVAGMVVALGGVWKDAPAEGFQPRTFLRSPLAAAMWGLLFGLFLTNDLRLLLAASIGAERMSVEFYKGFVRNRTPGKFAATTPLFPDWLKARVVLIPLYLFTWVAFCLLLLPDGSSPRELGIVFAITAMNTTYLWLAAPWMPRRTVSAPL